MKKILRQRFGEKVKKMRINTGVTQEVFAEKCGFARPYMSRIETGTANPSLDAIDVLAVALNVSVEELFRGL
jgi:transcriptional regulator with XRE-family HTH domain